MGRVDSSVEGGEYEAILGSKEVFRSKLVRCLALEPHQSKLKERNKNPEEITDFLRDAGSSWPPLGLFPEGQAKEEGWIIKDQMQRYLN